MNSFNEIQALLQDKADIQARIKLIPYDGNPEVKENASGKYLYIRKRVGSRLTSTYVDAYSEDLYQLLLRNAKELRELKKSLRKIEKRLAELGYEANGLSNRVLQNIDFARANMKANIYDQAILEGVATSYPQTEDIIDNGTVNGMTADDIQKILNLKHAWEFILDSDVAQADTDYYLLCHIAKLVNEGFFYDGGKIRGVPVKIGGSKYIPPIPMESIVIERINEIINSEADEIEIAINLCIFLIGRCQISSSSVACFSQLFESFFCCSLIRIWHINTLEVHGRIDGFYFLGFVLRDKIQTPDILVIFITFNENCVQIFVNILFKFLVIFLLNPSEAVMDKTEFQD